MPRSIPSRKRYYALVTKLHTEPCELWLSAPIISIYMHPRSSIIENAAGNGLEPNCLYCHKDAKLACMTEVGGVGGQVQTLLLGCAEMWEHSKIQT